MKVQLMIIGFFFLISIYVNGQENASHFDNNQKEWLPYEGGKEACRRFFNENINMDKVADPNLPKGRICIICITDAKGKAKIVAEPAQYYDNHNIRVVTYDTTDIGREFFRVARLIKWNTSCFCRFMIYITIPYNPNAPDGIVFLKS